MCIFRNEQSQRCDYSHGEGQIDHPPDNFDSWQNVCRTLCAAHIFAGLKPTASCVQQFHLLKGVMFFSSVVDGDSMVDSPTRNIFDIPSPDAASASGKYLNDSKPHVFAFRRPSARQIANSHYRILHVWYCALSRHHP